MTPDPENFSCKDFHSGLYKTGHIKSPLPYFTCQRLVGQNWPAVELDPAQIWNWVGKSFLLLSCSSASGNTNLTCQTEHTAAHSIRDRHGSYPSNTLLDWNTRGISQIHMKRKPSSEIYICWGAKCNKKGFNVGLLSKQQTCSPSLRSQEQKTSMKLTYSGQNLADLLNLRLRNSVM